MLGSWAAGAAAAGGRRTPAAAGRKRTPAAAGRRRTPAAAGRRSSAIAGCVMQAAGPLQTLHIARGRTPAYLSSASVVAMLTCFY